MRRFSLGYLLSERALAAQRLVTANQQAVIPIAQTSTDDVPLLTDESSNAEPSGDPLADEAQSTDKADSAPATDSSLEQENIH